MILWNVVNQFENIDYTLVEKINFLKIEKNCVEEDIWKNIREENGGCHYKP